MTKTVSSEIALEAVNLVLHMAKQAKKSDSKILMTPAEPFIKLARKIEGGK